MRGDIGRLGALLALGGLVAGCTGWAEPSAPVQLAALPEAGPLVAGYYAAHAWEEQGRCTNPRMTATPSSEIVEQSRDGVVLRTNYSYVDPLDAQPRIGVPGVLFNCIGTGERRFVLVRTEQGLAVQRMSGPGTGAALLIREDAAPPFYPLERGLLQLESVPLPEPSGAS